jgi:hypothetical protein
MGAAPPGRGGLPLEGERHLQGARQGSLALEVGTLLAIPRRRAADGLDATSRLPPFGWLTNTPAAMMEG